LKKNKPVKVRVTGQYDSLTDLLKHYLYIQPGQTISDLVESVQQRLAGDTASAKLEKHIERCLVKNPAFEEESTKGWFLDTRGHRGNDQLYQWLQKTAKPLNINDLRGMAKDRGIDPTLLVERDLVMDGRFLRLRDGRWVLNHWEVGRVTNAADLDKLINLMANIRMPMTTNQIARELFGCGAEGTDLLAALQKDRRFLWVGGQYWFVRDLLPTPEVDVWLDNGLLPFWRAEANVLGEAELMLILNDTDPNARDYILSSSDLRQGCLRVTKRMERLFAGLPPVAWITFQSESGSQECWYLRNSGRILGLGKWFECQGLAPGSKIRVARVAGEERVFSLTGTGEREAEVYAEGRRVQQLEKLRSRDRQEALSLEQLVLEVMRLFSSGLPESELLAAVRAIRPDAEQEVLAVLEQQPFYELTAEGVWRFNQAIQEAYERLARELQMAKQEMETLRQEVACAAAESQTLVAEKESLYGELIYLQNHHRDQESQLQERVRRLREQVEELQHEQARTRAELEKVYRRKEQLQQELEPVRQQILALRAERDSYKVRIEQLEARNMQLQSNLNRVMEEAQAEQVRLVQRIKEVENRLHNTLLANDDLQRTVAKLQEERRLLRRKMNSWPVKLALSISGLFGGGSSRDKSING